MKKIFILFLIFIVFIGCNNAQPDLQNTKQTDNQQNTTENQTQKTKVRKIISTYPNVKPIPELEKFFTADNPEKKLRVLVSGDPFNKVVNFYKKYFGIEVTQKSEALLESKASVYGIVEYIPMKIVAKAILGENYSGSLLNSTDKVKLVIFTDRQSAFKVEITDKFISPQTKQVVNKCLLAIEY